MVDFTKLLRRHTNTGSTDPREIFRSLPHPAGVNDLYDSQGEVLRTWSKRRDERDLVLKLPTGGGKTLVGLLIARASINQLRRPALILTPTRQLVQQIVAEGTRQNIVAEAYLGGSGRGLPARFLSGEAIGVTTYAALFNGRSKFGAGVSAANPVDLGTLILDDAHVSFDVVRGAFSMTIEAQKHKDLYDELCSMYRGSFQAIGRQGTFDDVISGKESIVLEVPHWNWLDRVDEVQKLLRSLPEDFNDIAWPILRDELPSSHALITRHGFTITPLSPPVHAIPSFANCVRRIFMSATISDDSEIVRAFGATSESVSTPIAPVTLAGVAERMILVPGWMQLNKDTEPDDLVDALLDFAEANDLNTLILTPSYAAASQWEGRAAVATTSTDAELIIRKMQSGNVVGPVVLANRYDGIDLPGDACRVLIMDGLPRGMSDYDMYRATALAGSAINTTLAQRIEQGIGRAARGASDYCVVVLSDAGLVSWLGQARSMDFLTAATRRQIEIGRTVSKDIRSKDAFVEAAQQCIDRDKGWKGYHAEELADAAEPGKPDATRIAMAVAEHAAIDQMRQARPNKAARTLQIASDAAPDDSVRGWLLQLRSRALHLGDDAKEAQTVQAAAFSRNRRLTRPLSKPPYKAEPKPSSQAKTLTQKIGIFVEPWACLSDFGMKTAALTPEASANQFEESMRAVGTYLGFTSERPDNDFNDGPDNLWRTADAFDFVIEAKSRTNDPKKPLKKVEHGQLLVSAEWFKDAYPNRECVRVLVYPNSLATNNANAKGSFALTMRALGELVSDLRMLLRDLCGTEADNLEARCAEELERHNLTAQAIFKRLEEFTPPKV